MKLHLGGHLTYFPPQRMADLDISLEQPTPLRDILAELNVPAGEVVLVVLNGELAELDTCQVTDQDRVELYPPIGGGGLILSRPRKRINTNSTNERIFRMKN